MRSEPEGKKPRLVEVAPLVREMMRRHGLTREALAKELDVTGVAVFYWLKGGRASRLYAERVRATAKRLAAKEARGKKVIPKNS